MITTKKLPHSMTKDGKATRHSEHLVPCLDTPRRNMFVGVKTGRTYNTGYLCYLGRDIVPTDVIQKLGLAGQAAADAVPILESFFSELSRLKIGNVVSVSFPEPEKYALKKEAERPRSGSRKLP